MKKSCFSLLLFLSTSTLGFSNILENLSGDIGVEYSKQETKNEKETQTDKLSQVLNLRYRNFLYDQRMLDYYFLLKFSKTDEDGKDNNQDKSSNYENTEYDIGLNFLQKSFMPFHIKARHTEKPSTIINEDSIVETTFNKTDYSLRGRVETPYLNIDYNANLDQSETSSQLGNKDLDSNSFGISFSKEFKDESRLSLMLGQSNSDTKTLYGDFLEEDRSKKNISTSYSTKDFHVNLNYTKKDESNNSVNNDETYTIDSIYSSLRYRFSDELSVNSSFDTEKNGKNESKNNSGDLRLTWKPSKSYNALVSIDANEYKVEDESYENYGVNISSNYKINKNWSNSQNLNFLNVLTPASTHESLFLSTTTNYRKDISPKTKFYLNNTISYITNDNTSLDATNEIEDDKTITFDTTLGINKKFDFWNARNGYELNYVKSFEEGNKDSQVIKLSTYLNTFPASNIEYNIEADISEEDKNEKEKKVVRIKNLFKYSKNIDVRGRLSITTGLNYKFEKEDRNTIKSLDPSLSFSFNYRLWRTLSFKTIYDIMVDESNKSTNHQLNAGLYYKYRNFEVDLTTKIIRQIKKEEENFMSESILLGIKRKF